MLVCQVALLRSFKYISRYIGVHKNIKAPAGSHSLSLKTSLARYQSGFAKMWQTSLQKLQNTWLHFTWAIWSVPLTIQASENPQWIWPTCMTNCACAIPKWHPTFDPLAIPICSMYRILSNIYLHLAQIYGKCRQIFHAWSIWDMDDLRATRVTTEPPNIHLCNGTIGGEVPNFGGLTQPTHVQSPMQVVSFKMWMWMMWMFRSFTELETIYLFASFTPPEFGWVFVGAHVAV